MQSRYRVSLRQATSSLSGQAERELEAESWVIIRLRLLLVVRVSLSRLRVCGHGLGDRDVRRVVQPEGLPKLH